MERKGIGALTLLAVGLSLTLSGCGQIDESVLNTQANFSVDISVPYATATPLPEEVRAHLFEGFYKADHSRMKQKNSYGLGLAIVKASVELHGCECGVYNETDGVCFWFDLPAYDLPEDEEADETADEL